MPRFHFGKLVRDKIVEQQLASGAKPDYRKLTDKEHIVALRDKLKEEAIEAAESGHDELIHELADVQQVVDDLLQKIGSTKDELMQVQQQKNDKRGGFGQGLYIEAVEVAEEDPWAEHFRNRPDHYPEIHDKAIDT